MRRTRTGAQLLGVAEPLGLRPQRVVLRRLGLDRLDALETDAQALGLTGALRRGAAQVSELGLGPRQLGVQRTVGGEGGREVGAAERVEHLAVLVGATQPPLVGLAVHGDEVLGELGEDPDRRRPSADVGA